MKQFLYGCALALVLMGRALAAEPTPTPIVGPNETGEDKTAAQQVFNMARLKLGGAAITATGTAAAATVLTAANYNYASGIVTWPAPLTIVSNATATLTMANTKIQAGDIVMGILDATGAAAGAIPEVASVQVTAGQAVFTLTNASATSPAVAIKVMFFVITKGNPN